MDIAFKALGRRLEFAAVPFSEELDSPVSGYRKSLAPRQELGKVYGAPEQPGKPAGKRDARNLADCAPAAKGNQIALVLVPEGSQGLFFDCADDVFGDVFSLRDRGLGVLRHWLCVARVCERRNITQGKNVFVLGQLQVLINYVGLVFGAKRARKFSLLCPPVATSCKSGVNRK